MALSIDNPTDSAIDTHASAGSDLPVRSAVIKRHGVFTRIWHWVNALCLLVLLMSGLQIFNAHPALYWGHGSTFAHPVLAIGAYRAADGQPVGTLDIGHHRFITTGVLGVSSDNGQTVARAFPSWATLPGSQWLSLGREWHFTAAWVFTAMLVSYLIYSVISGRRRRLIAPTSRDARTFGHAIVEHLRFRFERVRHYNPLQKLTYLAVLFGLLPLMIATGLSMSPTMDAAWPWLPAVLGGHQSARTLHFISAFLLFGFFLVHVALVLVSGLFNNLRSMTTGGYRIADASEDESNRQGKRRS
ncbi:MAG: cytochrome b/b6 domain-containing protein [Salinisphaera sp.]|jgi:thiosulfate reductase cytochrome b subunit|nr:cytochrome b/b6 domain-containing protein [Salinisphaera sp.]